MMLASTKTGFPMKLKNGEFHRPGPPVPNAFRAEFSTEPKDRLQILADARERPKVEKMSFGKALLGFGTLASTALSMQACSSAELPAVHESIDLEELARIDITKDEVRTYKGKSSGVQVVSTSNRETAELALAELQELGFSEVRAFVRQKDEGVTFQILVGNTEEAQDLELTKQTLRSHPQFADAFTQKFEKAGQDLSTYLQMGAYSEAHRAESVVSAAEDMGFNRLFIREVDGLFKVQMGPFQAESQSFEWQDRLEEKGLDSFIVRAGNTQVEQLQIPQVAVRKAEFRPFVLRSERNYSDKAEANNELMAWRQNGFADSTVVKEGRDYHLVLGAYKNQTQGDQMLAEAQSLQPGAAKLKWRRYYHGDYQAHGINFSRSPIPAKYFEGVQTSRAQVEKLLKRYDSWILREEIGADSMVDVIMRVSQAEQVDPLILLSRIQTEMSGVETSTRPSQEKLDWLTGHGATDEGRRAGHAGLSRQLIRSIRGLKEHYQSQSAEDFPLLKTVDYGKKTILVQDAAAYSLLQYTPHTVDTKLDRLGGGTYNAARIFQKYQQAVN